MRRAGAAAAADATGAPAIAAAVAAAVASLATTASATKSVAAVCVVTPSAATSSAVAATSRTVALSRAAEGAGRGAGSQGQLRTRSLRRNGDGSRAGRCERGCGRGDLRGAVDAAPGGGARPSECARPLRHRAVRRTRGLDVCALPPPCDATRRLGEARRRRQTAGRGSAPQVVTDDV